MSDPITWALVVLALALGVGGGIVLMTVRGQGALKAARREAAQVLSDAERNAAAMAKEAKTSVK